MSIPQDQLAQEFAQWSAANPGATDADIAKAIQDAGVDPLELALALGIDPEQGMNRYNAAIAQNPLSNPLTDNQSSTGNPLLSAAGSTLATSFINPDILTSTMGERAVPGVLGGVMNFAAADDADGRKDAALNTLISIIGGPAGTIFKAFLDQFGFFKGGKSEAVNLTPEQQVMQAYDLFQRQQVEEQEGGTEGQDARLTGLIMEAERLGLDATDMRNRLSAEFGIDSVPGDLPEGYVRDSQGFLRDVATEGYWLLDDGTPVKTTPPLVSAPMPDVSSGGSNPTTDSTTGADGGSPAGSATGSATGSPTARPGDWVYDSTAGVFRQTGGIETIVPKDGQYTNGQVLSTEEMQGKFGEWGANSENPTITPTDWMGILNTGGVADVIAEMARLNKTSEEVAEETGFSVAQVDQAIAEYNAQVAGDGGTGNTGGAGDTNGDGTGGTGGTGSTGAPTINPTITGGVSPTTATTVTTTGTGDGTGTGTGDGTGTGTAIGSGLLTSLVNNTPITSQLFKPEIFEAENKVSGLFDMVMRARA
jgi:hypothetical protein